MSKTLSFGSRLRYPITIVKLLKQPGSTIKKQEPLLQYSFKWNKEVGDRIRAETWVEEQTTIATWDSSVDGEVVKWQIQEGQVIQMDRTCLLVKESCTHEIQFQGLCAMCGKDMTEVNWVSDARDTERAPINMVHDQTNLTVSATQARRTESELQERLLKQRKLSLVVDLDQTIIHACIEPTIGEWQKDPSNPNYESVKEVRTFQLNDDGPRGLASGCNYYIKMRPGLDRFLSKIAELYELHVYTMGTRAYAHNIANIVDKDKKFFGNRVISRNENGSLTAKNLQRLFPSSTNMVVIIDDRADVWPNNRPNLIKVNPYDFFKGIGDINSSFLPKREEMLPPSIPDKLSREVPSASTAEEKKISALEGLVNMSGGEQMTQRQVEEQERTLAKQIEDRPLLHMQERLDEEDKSDAPAETDAGVEDPAANSQARHQLLWDDDHELEHLEQHLTKLHQSYYAEYDRTLADSAGVDDATIPDVGTVLDALKEETLRGVKLVLSGLIPLDVDVMRSELGIQVMSFGAQIEQHVRKGVTHVVVNTSRPRTQKAIKAASIPSIKIVSQDWLAACLTEWKKVDEQPYLIKVGPESAAPQNSDLSAETTDAEQGTDDDVDRRPAPKMRTKEQQLARKHRLAGIRSKIKVYVDTDDENEEERTDDGLMPSDIVDGQMSPVDDLGSFNWGAADEELREFLEGSDDDDDEGTADGDEPKDDQNPEDEDAMKDSTHLQPRPRSRSPSLKRKLDDDDGEPSGELNGTSKKQRLSGTHESARARTEQSKDADSSLPTPQGTGDEEDTRTDLVKDRNAVEEFEDDLEADLFAEFEAAGVEQEKG